MVSGGVTRDSLSKSNVYLYRICSLTVKATSVLWVQCGKSNHSRCTGVKRVSGKFSTHFAGRQCEGNIKEAVELEEKLCNEVETVRKLTHLSDWVSTGVDVKLLSLS